MDAMANETKPSMNSWRELASRIIKFEMAKRGVKYSDLSDRLARIGTQQSADNLRNKINKGILGADLFLQIILVLNVRKLAREELMDILHDLGVNHSDLE
ncbi:hypothetical protein KP814_07255 [Hahella sp. HN01]|nr:hypothetical protein [Hahella sp. HN01]